MIHDLHTHSHYSDGQLTPEDLVTRAAASGVGVLALTDHDVTAGLAEAEAAAQRVGIALVPGVEISVTWPDNRSCVSSTSALHGWSSAARGQEPEAAAIHGGRPENRSCVSGTSAIRGGRGAQTVHVVGLRIDASHAELQRGLARLREFREWRAEEIGRRLAKAGIADATAGARRYAQRGLVSRTHFAQYLVAAGHARDVRGVFKKFLVSGKPGHVPGQWATLTEAVGWIRASGGQAVLAHPARYKLTATRLKRLLGEFRDAGGEALEVVSGSHSRDDAFRFAHLAQHYGLLASAGSDFHGPHNCYFDLGPLPPLPEGCTPVWERWPARETRGAGREGTADDFRPSSLVSRS